MKGKYKTISLDRILDPENPLRDDINQESVKDLTASIKQIGIINPLIIKKSGDNYEVIAGHRRLVAAGIAGLTEAPCIIIKTKGMTSEVIKLQENLIRDKINPIEWANHLAYLKSQYDIENAKIAKMLGMSETWVGQHLQILDYPTSLIEALKADKLSFSSARELAQIKDPKRKESYIGYAVKGGITPTLAARWKKEANREPLTQPQELQERGEIPTANPNPEPLTQCIVCGENVNMEESLTLTIHQQCQPQEVPTDSTPQPAKRD